MASSKQIKPHRELKPNIYSKHKRAVKLQTSERVPRDIHYARHLSLLQRDRYDKPDYMARETNIMAIKITLTKFTLALQTFGIDSAGKSLKLTQVRK